MITKFFQHSEDSDADSDQLKSHFRTKRKPLYSPSSEEGDSVLSAHSFSRPRIPFEIVPYPSEEEFHFYFSQEEGGADRPSVFLSGEGRVSPKESVGTISSFEDRCEQRMLIKEDKKRCRFTSVSNSLVCLFA